MIFFPLEGQPCWRSYDLGSPVNCWRSTPTSLRALWRYNLTGRFLMATWKIVGWFTPYKSGVHSIFGWIIQTMQTYMGNLGGFTFQTALFGLVVSLTPCTWWRTTPPTNALSIQPRLVGECLSVVANTSILQVVKKKSSSWLYLESAHLRRWFHNPWNSEIPKTLNQSVWLMTHGSCRRVLHVAQAGAFLSNVWSQNCEL